MPYGWGVLVVVSKILQLGQGLCKCNLGDEYDTEPVVDQTVWDIGRFGLVSFNAKLPDVDSAFLDSGVGLVAIPMWQVVDH